MDAPLPLVPFESYMLEDDRAEYPMTFFLRLKFRGPIDTDQLRAAIRVVSARHPLLQSTVQTVAGRKCWISAPQLQPEIDCGGIDDPIQKSATNNLDLRRDVGLRFWVRGDSHRANILIEFHHACTDGVGAMEFVEDLLTAYAAEHAGDSARVVLRPLAPERLRDRARLGLNLVTRIARAPLAIFSAVGLAEFFLQRPTPVAAVPAVPRVPRVEGPAFVSHRLGGAQLARLRDIAGQLGVTVNDLLIRDLSLAVEQWNRRHGQGDSCVRISVPVNLRSRSDQGLSAANVVSMVFVDRRPARYSRPRQLLRSIRRDTWLIKRFRLALTLISFVSLLARFGNGLGRLLGRSTCMASAVLSNLGPQLDRTPLPRRQGRIDLGDAQLDEIEFLPPIRPLTRIAVGVITYAGQVTVSMQCDATCMSAAAAANLLAMYIAGVASTAAGHRDELLVHEPSTSRVPLRDAMVGWRRALRELRTERLAAATSALGTVE